MKSDDYDLEVLLELRDQEQSDAEETYARELAELRRRKQFVADKREELEDAVEQRLSECARHDERVRAGELTLAQMRAFDSFLDGLRADEEKLGQSIERARQSVAQKEREVAQAKEQMIEATKALEAVEKHRENWEEEQATQQQRREAAAMDEIAARRWMERNK